MPSAAYRPGEYVKLLSGECVLIREAEDRGPYQNIWNQWGSRYTGVALIGSRFIRRFGFYEGAIKRSLSQAEIMKMRLMGLSGEVYEECPF